MINETQLIEVEPDEKNVFSTLDIQPILHELLEHEEYHAGIFDDIFFLFCLRKFYEDVVFCNNSQSYLTDSEFLPVG